MDFRSQILSVAEEQFFGKRYGDVKLDSLARVLGIKKQSIYHYFSDKKDLILAVFQRSEKRYLAAFSDILLQGNPEDVVIWWLTYPAQTKNLFGIALQKEYCIDADIFAVVSRGKAKVLEKLLAYGSDQGLSRTRAFLLVQLLERLAQAHCTSQACLEIPVQEIAREIRGVFFAGE